jgi:hypothetical protein
MQLRGALWLERRGRKRNLNGDREEGTGKLFFKTIIPRDFVLTSAVVSLSAPTELLAAMGDQGREHPSDPLPQLGGRDEEWRRGGMERWVGREGTGNLLKLIIDIDLIFTSRYTKTFGGRASPGPVVELKHYPRLLGHDVWPGKGMPLQTA